MRTQHSPTDSPKVNVSLHCGTRQLEHHLDPILLSLPEVGQLVNVESAFRRQCNTMVLKDSAQSAAYEHAGAGAMHVLHTNSQFTQIVNLGTHVTQSVERHP